MKRIQEWINKIGCEEMHAESLTGLFQWIARELPKVHSTLSVGAGDGTEMSHWPGEVSMGLDINPINKKENVVIGDMHDMPFQDGEFELTVARDSFEHAVAPIVALSEMARVSSKYVCIVLPDEAWTESEWHLIIPTYRQMIALAEKVGLKLSKFRQIRFVLNGSFLLHNDMYLFEKEKK